MKSNNYLLRIALVVSYCLIDYTLAQDLVGGKIIEILIYFIASGDVMLTVIAAIYFACLIIWLASPLLTHGINEKKLLVVVSAIMVLPLVANVILLLSQIEIQFILWSTIFCILLYLNLRSTKT